MGKNTAARVRKLQVHLCSAVISHSRPVFPQQLSDRAGLNEVFQICLFTAVRRELFGNKDSWADSLFFVQPANSNGIYNF